MNDRMGILINEILAYIKEKGVHILSLQFNDNRSEYYLKLLGEITQKFERNNLVVSNFLPLTAMEDFFEELYTKEDAETVASPFKFKLERKDGAEYLYLKDISSKYHNVTDEERLTIGQPAEYDKTVYFFGPCVIVGAYVEDKHTIESFLQIKCNHNGNKCKIVNLGCWDNGVGTVQRILNTPIRQNDIIVMYLDDEEAPCVENLNLTDSLEKHNAPGRWFVNSPIHCNYIGNC